MADLKVKLGKLELSSPIIVSSGDVTRTEVGLKKAARYQPGAMVMKTAFPHEAVIEIKARTGLSVLDDTRAKYSWEDNALICAAGLSHQTVEAWSKWLKKEKKDIPVPLIGSVIGISVETYVKAAKLYEEAGVDAIEINYGCPAPYLRRFPYCGPLDQDKLREIVHAVRSAVSLPLGVKTGSFPWGIRIAEEAKLDFATINSSDRGAPAIDIETIEPVVPMVTSISGSPSHKYRNFLTITRVADLVKRIHISGVGGVRCWQDLVQYIMYGAGSVQIQSLFLREGFGVIPQMKKDLVAYMERHNFKTVEHMKGIILPKLMPFEIGLAGSRATRGQIVAVVDESRCNGCGLCVETCSYDIIKISDGLALIPAEECEGCRACVMNCPEGAVTLKNVELIRESGMAWAKEHAPALVEHGILAQDPRDRRRYWGSQA